MKEAIDTKQPPLEGLVAPKTLADAFLELNALGVAGSEPTEELVRYTMERCEKALRELKPTPKPVPEQEWAPPPGPFSWQTTTALPSLTQAMGPLNACLVNRAMPFARAHPEQSAILFIDNHDLIDPECWESDPSLMLLNHFYQAAHDVLKIVSGESQPIERLIILKADANDYDDKDLQVIRQAIEKPSTRCTYLVGAKYAGPFRERSCTLLAKKVLFEIEKDEPSKGVVVKDPTGTSDPHRVDEVSRQAAFMKEKAVCVYVGGKLDQRLATALGSNADLRVALQSI